MSVDRTEPDHHLAYFFIPLPEPLELPDKLIIPFRHFPQGMDDRSGLPSETEEGFLRLTKVSLVIHQRETIGTITGLRESFDAALAAFPTVPQETAGAPPVEIPGRCTVIEAMVLLDPGEDDESRIADALEIAIEHIRDMQRSYYMATQRPVTLVNSALLPPLIPFGLRELIEGEESPAWPTELSTFLVNGSMPPSLVPPDSAAASSNSERLFADSRLGGGPFETMSDLRREALVALRAGNTLSGAILFGAYTELFLRELHLMLLWDEGSTAQAAATATNSNRTITSIVRAEFHERLGGKWDTRRGDGELARWDRLVKHLRNRVVHTGYVPTMDELRDASNASAALERFVAGRLARRADRFATTALMYLGDQGLDDHRAARRFADAVASVHIPTDMPHAFSRWRFEVSRHRDGGPFEGSLAEAKLVLVRYLNDEYRWWLVDEDARLACQAKDRPLGQLEREILEQMSSGGVEVGQEVSIAVITDDLPGPLDDEPKWHSLMEVIPPGAANRFATSRIPPR